jgi:hypothetical protein
VSKIHLTDHPPTEAPAEKPATEIAGGMFHCPHCHTERPPYGFHMNGSDLGILGATQYMTVFCTAQLTTQSCGTCGHYRHSHRLAPIPGEIVCVVPNCTCKELQLVEKKKSCGAILSVGIIAWAPPRDPKLRAQFDAAMRGEIAGGVQ